MSSFIATVSEILSCDSLHIVKFGCNSDILSMMSLDLDKRVEIGTKLILRVKPSHIAIAKAFSGELSDSNQLKCEIVACTNGTLLSNIKLQYGDTTLESIITLDSSRRMNLKVGDTVVALIKASELSIGEILS